MNTILAIITSNLLVAFFIWVLWCIEQGIQRQPVRITPPHKPQPLIHHTATHGYKTSFNTWVLWMRKNGYFISVNQNFKTK
jgi:hypothetical protein